jgi:hypothetical protein
MKDKAALVEFDKGIRAGNRFLEVEMNASKGFRPWKLRSPLTGLTYADTPYMYRVDRGWGAPRFGKPRHRRRGGVLEVMMEGTLGPAEIAHRFTVPTDQPYIEETLAVTNCDPEPIRAPRLAMGFARSISEGGRVDEDLTPCRMTSVPFRRALQGRRDEYQEYDFDELRTNQGTYCPRWPETLRTPEVGAEGWIWTSPGGSLLVAKHSPEMIEFSVLSTEKRRGKDVMRFGGASIWHGDPEEGTTIAPGSTVTFSPTRYILVEGLVKEGYYAFRNYMDSQGHGTPPGFDPPVHWNELYDNPLWWDRDDFRKRAELYTLGHMEEEAAKAAELGCESLYLDPGWDTSFASSIWPPYRLREAGQFVELMDQKYGLKVSLHMPLAVWCDATAYPLEAHKRNEEGEMLDGLCSASPGYMVTKEERLLKLAEAGFAYFMFDGSAFTGECWDPSHGHSLPLTRSEHCRSILKLAQAVHDGFPDLIIELHDPMLGGVPERYAPMHYLHGVGASFDEGWGFEYMWDPMEDLVSGKAVSLYYYNLAYSLPLYIHIDLRKDNDRALIFWWYASTCRHLGVGGKHKVGDIWEAHKRAMAAYLRLKKFFTQGTFLGLGEDAHLHWIPGEKRAVLNVFNLDAKAVEREITIDLSEMGMRRVTGVSEGSWQVDGQVLHVRLTMRPRDARVVEISGA